MSPLPFIVRSVSSHCRRNSKPYFSQLIDLGKFTENSSNQWRKQTYRSLILQSPSESVRMERLSDSDSGIIEVKLYRPEVKNAIGKDMLRGLQHTLEVINVDSSANVVMICSSVPRVFCAGADLKERRTMSPSDVQIFVNSLRSTFSLLEALCIPTIAVIEGVALGGGLEMALACDLRICGNDASFGLPETGLAIIPGSGSSHSAVHWFHRLLFINSAGGTQRLPRLVGKSVAKELIFTGGMIEAKAAMKIGLVNYCVPAGSAHLKALEIARDINRKGPLAIRMAKRAINGGLEMDISSAMALEEECYEPLLNSKDRLEGLAAFAEKRTPIYIGE